MQNESLYVEFAGETLALHRFRPQTDSGRPPVLLIHGSIENGKIFYSRSGKGFAPFLAQNGFDVFVADLRGKGASTPRVNRGSRASQTDTIEGEIPFLVQTVKNITGSDSLHLGAHSWGGVLLMSAYALLHAEWNIRSMIFFGTKRRIGIRNWHKFTTIDLGWTLLGSLATWYKGYLPAKKLKMGSDDEPRKFYFQLNRWVYSRNWIDPETGFDYRAKIRTLQLPPLHFYTGIHDRLLGHPADVRRLVEETGQAHAEVKILGKQNGNLHDYNHIDILTHPDAVHDHFPEVLGLLIRYS